MSKVVQLLAFAYVYALALLGIFHALTLAFGGEAVATTNWATVCVGVVMAFLWGICMRVVAKGAGQ